MVRMEVSKIPKFRRLVKEDRILIAQWKNEGFSNKQIAKRLGRDKSTIGREIIRNNFEGKVYEPLHAQYKAEVKKNKAWEAKEPLKNPWVYSYVLDKLRQGWSPEQIAGRLKLEYLENTDRQIGVETVYRFIYKPGNRKLIFDFVRPFDLIPKYTEKCERSPACGGASEQSNVPQFSKCLNWSGCPDSNRGPRAPEARALPAEPHPEKQTVHLICVPGKSRTSI